jgi:hypothetical protein
MMITTMTPAAVATAAGPDLHRIDTIARLLTRRTESHVKLH